jgi:hypothetical protein
MLRYNDSRMQCAKLNPQTVQLIKARAYYSVGNERLNTAHANYSVRNGRLNETRPDVRKRSQTLRKREFRYYSGKQLTTIK